MSKKEQQGYIDDHNAMVEKFQQQIVDIRPVMQTMVRAPYDLGEALLQLALTMDGNDKVNALFEKPPTTDENLLDPWTVLENHEGADKVAKPKLADGENAHKDGSGDFGSLTWYVLLAGRIPVKDALLAADGWGGDSYVALDRWVKAASGAPASVQKDGDEIAFESCDPGVDAKVGRDASQEAIQLAVIRSSVGNAVLQQTKDEEFSRCYAQGAVDRLTLEELSSTTELSEPVKQALQAAMAKCRT